MLVHGPPRGAQLGPRSVSQLPDAWVGETPPEALDVWCRTPQHPRRHVCPWMADALFLLRGRGTRKPSYSAVMRTSLPEDWVLPQIS